MVFEVFRDIVDCELDVNTLLNFGCRDVGVAPRPTFVVDDHPSILACVVLLHIGKSIGLRHIEIDVVLLLRRRRSGARCRKL